VTYVETIPRTAPDDFDMRTPQLTFAVARSSRE
jgi:hypothetical protein